LHIHTLKAQQSISRKSDPSKALTSAIIHEKCITRFNWICSWVIMKKCNTAHPRLPAWVVLNCKHLKVLESIIPQNQKNISTLKWSTGQLSTTATRQWLPSVVMNKYLEKLWSLSSIENQQKIHETAMSVWFSL
jgi:hypothetical protein